MTVLASIGSPVVVRRAPHWSNKGFVLANGPFYGPYSGTAAQLRARRALTAAAIEAYGQHGFPGGIPVVAARVAAATSGQSHGGRDPNAVRAQAHEMAQKRLAAYDRRIAQMMGGGRAAGGAGEASFF